MTRRWDRLESVEESPWVDWQASGRIATRLAPPGPRLDRDELTEIVAELRGAAGRAAPAVIEACALSDAVPVDRVASPAPVLVVDRRGWVRANAQSMSRMTARALPEGRGMEVPAAAQGTATVEVAGLLAFLSRKVLGQYDPYGGPTAQQHGRLLLVAPNVLEVERSLRADPSDFRLWVCLHELTHAFQFAAAPWLAEHVLDSASQLTSSLMPAGHDADAVNSGTSVARRLRRFFTVLRGIGAAVAGRPGASLVDAFLSERERRRLADVTAVMALLEGHADVVMDEVGPEVVPSVDSLRRGFDARRRGATGAVRVLNRLLGMEAKLAQYRDGAAFVRGVVAEVGHEGLNVVWTAPEYLPGAEEIVEPIRWVRRVHG